MSTTIDPRNIHVNDYVHEDGRTFSVRALKAFQKHNVKTLGQIAGLSREVFELTKKCGASTMLEIEHALKLHGLKFSEPQLELLDSLKAFALLHIYDGQVINVDVIVWDVTNEVNAEQSALKRMKAAAEEVIADEGEDRPNPQEDVSKEFKYSFEENEYLWEGPGKSDLRLVSADQTIRILTKRK